MINKDRDTLTCASHWLVKDAEKIRLSSDDKNMGLFKNDTSDIFFKPSFRGSDFWSLEAKNLFLVCGILLTMICEYLSMLNRHKRERVQGRLIRPRRTKSLVHTVSISSSIGGHRCPPIEDNVPKVYKSEGKVTQGVFSWCAISTFISTWKEKGNAIGSSVTRGDTI